MPEKFYKKVLKNGMTVILEKRKLPVVSLAFAVRAGSNNEDLNEKGLFHFMEHMLYKGTEKREAKDIAGEIEKIGGDLNGFTNENMTAFWCKLPSKHLNVGLDVLSDMIKNSKFDKKEFEKEKGVILEEIKMYDDSPRDRSIKEAVKLLFGGPMSLWIAGNSETVKNINLENMKENYKNIFRPEHLVLCVVGDADFDFLCKWAAKNFPVSKKKIDLEKVDIPLKKLENKTEKRKSLQQANFVMVYHAPRSSDKKKSYAARVLNTLMAQGLSSRLFTEIREKRNLAYIVKGALDMNDNFSYGLIYVGCMKENLEKVKKLIVEEFEKVSKDLEKKEFDQAKEQLLGNYDISSEDSVSQMEDLLAFEINGDAKELYNFKEDVSKVKIEDVKKLAGEIAKKNGVFILEPED